MRLPPAWVDRAVMWLPVLPAWILVSLLLPQVLSLGQVASLSPFGRDQGIFHYQGWAILQGEILHRDVRDVNGPLTAWVHAAAIAVGAGDEVRFRTLTLLLDAVTFAIAGACLPGLIARPGERPARPTWARRAAWSLASVAVLGAQYFSYDYWHSTQRETFCNWFMLPAIGATLLAAAWYEGESELVAARRQRIALFASGLLATVPILGKPTYALPALLCLVGVLAVGAVPLSPIRRALWWCAGAAAATAILLTLFAATGDLAAFLHIWLEDVSAMYRFIWPRPASWFLEGNPRSGELWLGLALTAVFVILLTARKLPRRTLAIALLPVAAIIGVVAQRKGFAYHHHLLSAAVRLQLVVLAIWAAESIPKAGMGRPHLARCAAVTLFVLCLGWFDIARSPHWSHRALTQGPRGPERESAAYFAAFPEPGFHPWEMRLAARWIAERTQPDDRVQVYGMDPYLLFLAGRLSATPYIYAYDLSAGAALAGGEQLRPNEAQSNAILAIRERHETDLLARLEARPPGAFVLVDDAPTMTYADALKDLQTWCPRTAAWLEATFEPAAQFGAFRIFTPRSPTE